MTANYISISTDIFGILVILVLIYGIVFDNPSKTRKSKSYLRLLISVAVGMFFDTLSWAFNGNSNAVIFLAISDFITMVSMQFIALMFFLYLLESLREVKTVTRKHALILMSGNCAILILSFVLTCLKLSYTYDDNGFFVEGSMYWISAAGAVLTMFYSECMVLCNFKQVGLHDSVSLLAYCLFPLAAFIVSLFYSEIYFGFIAVTVSMVVIYVLLQSKNYSILRSSEHQLKELTYVDTLTGTVTRRGYNEALDLRADGCNVGVIFTDINGLKYVNDTQGHVAGDELITKYSDLLKSIFPRESIYRISGDEFVIILKDIEKKDFEEKVKVLQSMIHGEDDIASAGAIYGKYQCILQLVNESEKLMYEDKRRFHKLNPQMERRSIVNLLKQDE